MGWPRGQSGFGSQDIISASTVRSGRSLIPKRASRLQLSVQSKAASKNFVASVVKTLITFTYKYEGQTGFIKHPTEFDFR